MSGEHAPCMEDKISTSTIDNVDDYFEIGRCREWCADYSNIALQFPDHLLAYSSHVYNALSSPSTHVHILADTNYGSCCVDEVAAQRLNTQAIVHFGHSCNSRVLTLPTLFVYGREHVDVSQLSAAFRATFTSEDHVLVVLSPVYYHVRKALRASLAQFSHVVFQEYALQQNTAQQQDDVSRKPAEEFSVFYVGPESLALTNCVLTNGSRKVWSYDPTTQTTRLESKSVNKMLIKRFSNIEKIKNSKIIGILVGTLGIKNFRYVIDRMKKVIKAAEKKYYVVSIGKPNPPKLANFAEIGAFVLIGCPENSLLDTSEFYQPIATPYELEIACVDRPWDIDYISDCSSLLNTNYIELPEVTESEDPNERALEKFRSLDVSTNFLNDRTWSGLQQRLGMDEPAVLKDGQKGIAGFYEDEDVCDSRMN